MTGGTRFGRYHVLSRLGTGGMAEVLLAKPLGQPQRFVALKLLLEHLARDRQLVSMFIDEARIAHRLHHPNICRVLDAGRQHDRLFMAMEFVHGKDLRVLQQRLRAQSNLVPFGFSALLVARIAEALDSAHHARRADGTPLEVVHRDISPHNILVGYDGRARLIDFGVAKARDRLAETRAGTVKGKFGYMAPEQVTGANVDGRADLFALGIVLYELLTGKSPFIEATDVLTVLKVADGKFTPPRQINRRIPQPLCDVVRRALERKPGARYQRGLALAADLHEFLADEPEICNEQSLSILLRQSFHDEYQRESARLRTLAAMEPPPAIAPGQLPPLRPSEQPDDGDTRVEPSPFLAAGYGAEED